MAAAAAKPQPSPPLSESSESLVSPAPQVSQRGATSEPELLKYVVREGDTLWSIARAHGVSTSKVLSINGLGANSVLRIGQVLEIPGTTRLVIDSPAPSPRPVASQPPVVRNLAHLQLEKASTAIALSVLEDTTAESATPVSLAQPRAISRLRQKRELLRSSLSELRTDTASTSASPVEGSGETVEVLPSAPLSDKAVQADVFSSPSDSFHDSQAGNTLVEDAAPDSYEVHQIEPGETLGAIALAHNVDVHELATINQLTDPDQLQVNQSLLIPNVMLPADADAEADVVQTVTVTAQTVPDSVADSADSELLSAATNVQPDPASALGGTSDPLSRPSRHQIQRGETLALIARRYGVSLQELISTNSIRNPNRIFVGQVIRIPTSPVSQQVASAPAVQASVNIPEPSQETLIGAALPSSESVGVADIPTLLAAPVMPLPVPRAGQAAAEASGLVEQDADVGAVESEGDSVVDVAATVVTTDSANSAASGLEAQRPLRTSESGSNVYVENLINEIDSIQERMRSESQVAARFNSGGGASAQDTQARPVATDAEYLRQGDAINPEFAADPLPSSSESAPSPADERRPLRSQQDGQLLAAAPLGSQNYAPLTQPVTGRMVSPELPPLPGPENYLPNGPATFNGYLWPARGVLTSGYGWRWGRMHRGIDIAAPVGTPIYAAAPGVIEFAGWNSGGYGNMVDIRHPDGSKTRYAHNSRNLVRAGQTVTQGQQIAEMGSTGYSTGPHVHFEVHLPERGTVNPVALLPQR